MLLGIIGDDFTGSSDIANTLSKSGMRVTQYSGVPSSAADATVEAGIVSLKTRTITKEDAVEQSLEAARWLLSQGCTQLFFKYCSTFDSTKEGNIGPVTEALADLVGEEKIVMCPAFPTTGRTVFQGHLFVGDELLSDSGMLNHPLTPMIDSDLRRWLGHQTPWPVHHIPYADVEIGVENIMQKLDELSQGMVIVDAVTDKNLITIGAACKSRKLLTGGSGLALGLPENFRQEGLIESKTNTWKGQQGGAIIISGSCSNATRAQVEKYKSVGPSYELSAEMIIEKKIQLDEVVNWAFEQDITPLVYTSAEPDVVKAAQEQFGMDVSADAIEDFFGQLAKALVDKGVTRIITAGGETSGAVVLALGIEALEIGPEIAPGVPAMRANEQKLVIALKSGNFGQEDFFERGLNILSAGS